MSRLTKIPESKWSVPKMWPDAECWIIGGGSSVPRQFGVPEAVIRDVTTGVVPMSAYSEYMRPLHDKHVIGTNVAYLLGNWISVCYFCDLPFYRNNKYKLQEWHNLKVTDAGNLPEQEKRWQKNIKVVGRENMYGLSTQPNCLRWNRNAGAGAINLAALFGCKRILLLGLDMKEDESGRTHFHHGLPSYGTPTPPVTFKRFLKCFDHIANDAKALGIEIINVNDDSAITQFPKVKLEQVL